MVSTAFPTQAVRSKSTAGLQLFVQLNRLLDRRLKVMSICENVSLKGGSVTGQDIFFFKKLGLDKDANVKGQMIATGIRPRCFEALQASGGGCLQDG